MNELRAGVSKINITPPVRGCLAGFAKRKGQPSIGIHDDLYAKVIVLEKGETKTAIITTDTLGFDAELTFKIKKLIYKETGIKHTLLSASHTHCGPLLGTTWTMKPAKKDYAYMDVLSRKIAGAVYMAANNMINVRIKSGTGYAKIGINRRPKDKDGKVTEGENPGGPIDTEVPVFILERENGTILAILLNYACHPIAAGGSLYISADYPGYTQKLIEDELGCVALFTQGAGANINPIGFQYMPPSPYILAEAYGEKVGRAVLSIVKKKNDCETNPFLMVKSKKISIPIRREFFGRNISAISYYLKNANIKRIKEREFSYELFVMRIDDCLFVGLEGEPCVEIGLEIKKKIFEQHKNIKETFIIGYAGNTAYYITIPEMYKEGGYELKVTLFDMEASDLIINSVLKIVNNMCKI